MYVAFVLLYCYSNLGFFSIFFHKEIWIWHPPICHNWIRGPIVSCTLSTHFEFSALSVSWITLTYYTVSLFSGVLIFSFIHVFDLTNGVFEYNPNVLVLRQDITFLHSMHQQHSSYSEHSSYLLTFLKHLPNILYKNSCGFHQRTGVFVHSATLMIMTQLPRPFRHFTW